MRSGSTFATLPAGVLFLSFGSIGVSGLGCASRSAAPELIAPVAGSEEPDAGSASRGPTERPFAHSTAEATTLIASVFDTRRGEIGVCVREFRVRMGLAHDKVAVTLGIDQEGRVLGVTSKGKEDTILKACVQNALKGAAFPRSHAGVITVTKTYEDVLQ